MYTAMIEYGGSENHEKLICRSNHHLLRPHQCHFDSIASLIYGPWHFASMLYLTRHGVIVGNKLTDKTGVEGFRLQRDSRGE